MTGKAISKFNIFLRMAIAYQQSTRYFILLAIENYDAGK